MKNNLTQATIYAKTVNLREGPSKMDQYKQIVTKSSYEWGHCERYLLKMSKISNQNICSSKKARNIGYYYKVTFSTMKTQNYTFHLAVDFGWGGIVYVDGQIVKSYNGSIWDKYGYTTELDFEKQMDPGTHVLEVIGGESCCDGQTTWKYKTEKDSDWKEFSLTNLNKDCGCGLDNTTTLNEAAQKSNERKVQCQLDSDCNNG